MTRNAAGAGVFHNEFRDDPGVIDLVEAIGHDPFPQRILSEVPYRFRQPRAVLRKERALVTAGSLAAGSR